MNRIDAELIRLSLAVERIEERLAAGVSIFELARVMGTSVRMVDRTYGHLARDSEDRIRGLLDTRADRSGVVVASDHGDD